MDTYARTVEWMNECLLTKVACSRYHGHGQKKNSGVGLVSSFCVFFLEISLFTLLGSSTKECVELVV